MGKLQDDPANNDLVKSLKNVNKEKVAEAKELKEQLKSLQIKADETTAHGRVENGNKFKQPISTTQEQSFFGSSSDSLKLEDNALKKPESEGSTRTSPDKKEASQKENNLQKLEKKKALIDLKYKNNTKTQVTN